MSIKNKFLKDVEDKFITNQNMNKVPSIIDKLNELFDRRSSKILPKHFIDGTISSSSDYRYPTINLGTFYKVDHDLNRFYDSDVKINVFKFEDEYVKFKCQYTSYNGYDGVEYSLVFPKTIELTIYE